MWLKYSVCDWQSIERQSNAQNFGVTVIDLGQLDPNKSAASIVNVTETISFNYGRMFGRYLTSYRTQLDSGQRLSDEIGDWYGHDPQIVVRYFDEIPATYVFRAANPQSRTTGACLRDILNGHWDDDWEPGMFGGLQNDLECFVEQYGVNGAYVMREEIMRGEVPPTVLSEMVRSVGRMKDSLDADAAFAICETALESALLEVRDAASLAFVDLKDPRAAPLIEDAAKKEMSELVKFSQLKIANWLKSLR